MFCQCGNVRPVIERGDYRGTRWVPSNEGRKIRFTCECGRFLGVREVNTLDQQERAKWAKN